MPQACPRSGVGDQPLGDQEIGQKHVLLDEFVRVADRVGFAHQGRLAVVVQFEGELDRIQCHRSVPEAQLAPGLGYFVHQPHVSGHLVDRVSSGGSSARRPEALVDFVLPRKGNLVLDDVLGRRIIQSSTGLDDRPPVPHVLALDETPITVHSPHTGKGKAFHVFVEAARDLAKRSRQHGNGSVYQVHSGTATLRFQIDRTIGTHEVGNVGNVHPYFYLPVAQVRHVEGVVQVLCRGRINGKYPLLSVITSALVHVPGRPPARFGSVEVLSRCNYRLAIVEYECGKLSVIDVEFH
mmetsp:Transcript_93129/g.189735  ORF Transcript_93129/g.189735 Transcript_93129/m.189735 type:complete len:295 (+) Transcript_93129:900-1784(+)